MSLVSQLDSEVGVAELIRDLGVVIRGLARKNENMGRISPKVVTLSLCIVVICITLFLMFENSSSFKSWGFYPAMIHKMEKELQQDGINFTSVILASDPESLARTLKFHCSLPCIQKIVVVWNNLESSASQRNGKFNGCSSDAIEVLVLQQRDNSINNQLKPFTGIDTDG